MVWSGQEGEGRTRREIREMMTIPTLEQTEVRMKILGQDGWMEHTRPGEVSITPCAG